MTRSQQARLSKTSGRSGVSSRTASRLTLPLQGATLLLAVACSQELPPDIVLLTIDTLRADHLGCYGYDPYELPVSPEIDRLASRSVLFERCYVPRGQTLPSLTSLLTGLYPSSHDVRENGIPFDLTVDSLGAMLRRAGFETAAYLAVFPGPQDRSVATPFRDFRSPWYEKHLPAFEDENDETVTRLAIEFIHRQGDPAHRSKRYFLWIHLFDVHKPFAPRSPYLTRFLPSVLGEHPEASSLWDEKIRPAIVEATRKGERLPDPDQRRVLALYDGGIASADERVGRILAALEQENALDPAFLVLTADHGEELGDHNGYYYHSSSVYDSVLNVPLIVKGPHQREHRRVTSLVENIDLVPTILEAALLAVPQHLEGVALGGLLEGRQAESERTHVFAEWQDLIETIRSREWKYVFNPQGAHPRKPPYDQWKDKGFAIACEELYDVASDPGETRNLVESEPAVASALRAELETFRERPLRRSQMTRGVTESLRPALEETGYTGAPEDRSDVLLHPDDCGR
ncbi:MAG: sulfatase [Planctomycetota bacterium]